LHPIPAWRPTADVAALTARGQLLADIREFFRRLDVLEVQTPVLMPDTVTEPMIDSIAVIGGGWLQTSPEYAMKRLLAAGAPAIYQLGPVFRAGERGRWHNPEFTLLEWYRPGFDDQQLMEELASLVDVLLGAGSYRQVTYGDLVADDLSGDAADLAYAQACAALEGRCFVTHFPRSQASLARLHADGKTAARFELIVAGVEIANGYHENGDAVQLRERFNADNARRRRLGKTEINLDECFLAANAHGIPSCAGVAVGVDRLLMLQQGSRHIHDVLAFPAPS
jgi:elongation factor P--(R)-beta-lysine ligase